MDAFLLGHGVETASVLVHMYIQLYDKYFCFHVRQI